MLVSSFGIYVGYWQVVRCSDREMTIGSVSEAGEIDNFYKDVDISICK
jgi:hypothetical protein